MDAIFEMLKDPLTPKFEAKDYGEYVNGQFYKGSCNLPSYDDLFPEEKLKLTIQPCLDNNVYKAKALCFTIETEAQKERVLHIIKQTASLFSRGGGIMAYDFIYNCIRSGFGILPEFEELSNKFREENEEIFRSVVDEMRKVKERSSVPIYEQRTDFGLVCMYEYPNEWKGKLWKGEISFMYVCSGDFDVFACFRS